MATTTYYKHSKYLQRIEISVVREKDIPVESCTSPKTAAIIARNFIRNDLDREMFGILCLDTKNRIAAFNVVSVGSLNASIVHPREIFKPALLANSASVILVHNHPSGDPTPSKEDLAVTRRMVDAGQIMGIEVKDHIILGDGEVDGGCYLSFKEKGLI